MPHPHSPFSILDSRFSILFIFLASLAFFSLLQPWGNFPDPDTFYHAKLADIILHGPPPPIPDSRFPILLPTFPIPDSRFPILNFAGLSFLQNFPWLDLTLLGNHFVDQHLLYHIALTPFIALFGMLPGTQIATVIFSALFVTIFYVILCRLKIQHPLLWVTLATISMPLSFRLSLGKATPFALAAFILGIAASAKESRIKNRESSDGSHSRFPIPDSRFFFPLAFLAGLLFSLSHGGWMILLIAQALYFIGTMIFDRTVGRTGDINVAATRINPFSILDSRYSILFASLGIALGLLIHPNRANLLPFLHTQIIQVAFGMQASSQLGLEWGPSTMGDLIANLGPLIMTGGIVLLGLILAARRPLDTERARTVIGLGMILAALTAFTLKSSRMIEYLVPVLALWLGSLWTLVNPTHFKQELYKRLPKTMSPSSGQRIPDSRFPILAAVFLLLLVITRDIRGTYRALHVSPRAFDRLTPIVEVLKKNTAPGERIFHDRWDSFGELFALAPEFRYLSGVDPTFLLADNPDLGRAYEQITTSSTMPVPPSLQTRYSILERTDHCRTPNTKPLAQAGRAIVCVER